MPILNLRNCSTFILVYAVEEGALISKQPVSGADLGGDASPPTSLKVTISTEKSASISKN